MDIMETFIVMLIVGLAGAYLINTFTKERGLNKLNDITPLLAHILRCFTWRIFQHAPCEAP